jgi:hypothetical protein
MEFIDKSITDKSILSQRGVLFGLVNYIYNQYIIYCESDKDIVELDKRDFNRLFNISDDRSIKKYLKCLKEQKYIDYEHEKIQHFIKLEVFRSKYKYTSIDTLIFNTLRNDFRFIQLYLYYKKKNEGGIFVLPYTQIQNDIEFHSTYIKKINTVLEKAGLLKIGIVVDEEGTVKQSYTVLGNVNDIDLLDEEDIVISNNSIEGNTQKKLIRYNCPEARIEKYLINKLDLIEKGMQYINCQYSVENGFVDILAKDMKGNMCIIEVKNNPYNKDICFQSLYYPQTIGGNTRMIVLNSDYQNRILKALKQIENIEIYKYRLTINDDSNEISSFDLQRVI